MRVFRERLSKCVCLCVSFPFGFMNVAKDLILLVPDHCLSLIELIKFATDDVYDLRKEGIGKTSELSLRKVRLGTK